MPSPLHWRSNTSGVMVAHSSHASTDGPYGLAIWWIMWDAKDKKFSLHVDGLPIDDSSWWDDDNAQRSAQQWEDSFTPPAVSADEKR